MKTALIVILGKVTAVVGIAYALPKKPASKANPLCQLCLQVVTLIEKYLEENEEAEEEAVIEAVCEAFGSGGFEKTCEQLVKTLLPLVIDYIEKNEPPQQACGDIGLC